MANVTAIQKKGGYFMKRGRIAAGFSAAVMFCSCLGTVPAVPVQAADRPDYAKALQMSLYFYECQQAGVLPEWNRVEWRSDSTVGDDLNGGWYDAGDHVKFNLPMSYSAAMLAWGLYEYPDGVEQAGEMTNYVNNLKWVLDYLAQCDLGDEAIFQVGNGQDDHSWWGPVELLEYGMKEQNVGGPRGHLQGRDCSAVTAEMGAALAAGSVALKGRVSQSVLDNYLKHAVSLFKMADADRSDDTYMNSDAKNFYRSSHFYDELFWCANWLYIATKDSAYLDKAASYIPNLGKENGQDCLKYTWAQCWDDVQQGGTLLYAINTGDETWKAQAKKHVMHWATDGKKTKDGLCFVDTWGCLRYANSIGFTAAVAYDHFLKDDADAAKVKNLYETQINYTLGQNSNKIPYIVGFSDNAPSHPHHRTAHCSWKNSDESPEESRHILYGALVGGPNEDGSYVDKRNNFVNNEVATDYNAGYTALLCKMLNDYGGKSDPKFPYPETRDDELYVEAKATHDSGGSTLSLKITNHTGWPARRIDNVSMRYYMDLSELVTAGVDPTSIEMRCDRDQTGMYASEGVKSAVISKPTKYDGNIYYIEITFPDGRAFLPISEGRHQCEIMLALVYPGYGKGWDGTNDYSAQGLSGTSNTKTKYITVYESGVLVYGTEPDGTTGKGSISANPAPDGQPHTNPQESTDTTETTTTTTTPKGNPSEILWGDADCSNSVDVLDAVLLARVAAEDTKCGITDQGKTNSDVTHDGAVKNDDLTKLLKYLAGLVPDLAPSK